MTDRPRPICPYCGSVMKQQDNQHFDGQIYYLNTDFGLCLQMYDICVKT